MKIRTDFVTNSSSSSFSVVLSIELKDEKEISWRSGEYYTEGSNYLNVRLSPKQMGECDTIDSMIELILKKIRKKAILNENSEFITSLRQVSSVHDIKKITLDSITNGLNGDYSEQILSYNIGSKEYKMLLTNGRFESDGSSGELDIKDYQMAVVDKCCETMCVLSIKLTLKNAAAKEYIVSASKANDLFYEQSNKIILTDFSNYFKNIESMNELLEILDNSLFVDGDRVELGKLFFSANKCNIDLDDIESITLVLNNRVIKEQELTSNYITNVYGCTKYIFSLDSKTIEKHTVGNTFEYGEDGVVEIVPYDSQKYKCIKECAKISSIGTLCTHSSDDIQHCAIVERWDNYPILCYDRNIKPGDYVWVYYASGSLDLERVHEVCNRSFTDIANFYDYKTIIGKCKWKFRENVIRVDVSITVRDDEGNEYSLLVDPYDNNTQKGYADIKCTAVDIANASSVQTFTDLIKKSVTVVYPTESCERYATELIQFCCEVNQNICDISKIHKIIFKRRCFLDGEYASGFNWKMNSMAEELPELAMHVYKAKKSEIENAKNELMNYLENFRGKIASDSGESFPSGFMGSGALGVIDWKRTHHYGDIREFAKAVVKHYLPDTDKTEETVEINMKSHEIIQKAFYII